MVCRESFSRDRACFVETLATRVAQPWSYRRPRCCSLECRCTPSGSEYKTARVSTDGFHVAQCRGCVILFAPAKNWLPPLAERLRQNALNGCPCSNGVRTSRLGRWCQQGHGEEIWRTRVHLGRQWHLHTFWSLEDRLRSGPTCAASSSHPALNMDPTALDLAATDRTLDYESWSQLAHTMESLPDDTLEIGRGGHLATSEREWTGHRQRQLLSYLLCPWWCQPASRSFLHAGSLSDSQLM